MTATRTRGVLIAGAGIGGLTAALCLHAAGIDVTVVESARRIRPLGVGINLQPRAVGELVGLGLGADLAAIAVATAEHVYVDESGARLFTEPRGQAAGHRWPQYSVHRGELQMMLLSAVRERLGEDAVRTGVRLDDVEQTPTGVHARLTDRHTSAAIRAEADALIGADGLHSVVRARLHPDEGPLRWSGIRMWRGATESTAFLTGRSMVLANRGPVRFLAYPISPADGGRALVNWVCMVPVSDPGPLPGSAEDAGWNRVGRAEDVLPHCSGWSWAWLDVPALITGSEQILEYPMVDRDPLPWWGRDRVTLLGDAAHPMYPIGANGGSQAILDASALADALATTDDPAAGLVRYEDTRREATSAVVRANRQMDRAERAGSERSRLREEIAAITDTYRTGTSAGPQAT
jgi:5-methylphenazine-1-carboxylate 1-monooxygenase